VETVRKKRPARPVPPPSSRRLPIALLLAGIGVLAGLAYLPSLTAQFQFDDYARIIDNENLHQGNFLRGILGLGGPRLIPSATLALNFLVGGEATPGYHAVNLVVHLLAAAAVFALAWQLYRTPVLRDRCAAGDRAALSLFAAALFACHPLQTQAVTYIIQRAASMATLFYVASLAAFVTALNRSERSRSGAAAYALSALFGVCAVLSKENAVTLPVALLLTLWIFFPARWKIRTVVIAIAGCVLVAAIPLACKLATMPRFPALAHLPWPQRLWARLLRVIAQPMEYAQGLTPWQYFLTQCTVLPRYLVLLVNPFGLNVDHDVAVASGLSAAPAAGLLFLLALAAAGFALARRAPLVGYGILWFFVTMSVESSFLPIGDAMMEHRMYLAMPGICLAAGAGFVVARRHWRRVADVAGVALIALLALLTYQRNEVWQTPLSLWTDALHKSPHKARVHLNVGVAYHGIGELDEAIRQYCEALALDPSLSLARDNIEIALDQQGKLDEVIRQGAQHSRPAKNGPPGSVVIEYDVAAYACPKQGEGTQPRK
jgi:protein O-mannosyl-transferase